MCNLTQKKSKVLKICVLATFAVLINVSDVFSAAAVVCKCENYDGSKSCGSCSYKGLTCTANGTGAIVCIGSGMTEITDYCLDKGLISPTMAIEQKTSIFIIENSAVPNVGKGYIDVTALYNLPTDDGDYGHVYKLCDAIEIEDYNEWLAACNCHYYNGNKVVVYPNPTNAAASVYLEPAYINVCSIVAVEYKLYNSSNTLLTTFNPNDVTDVVQIPATLIATQGTYFIVCKVTSQNGTDEIKVPFTVLLQSGGGH